MNTLKKTAIFIATLAFISGCNGGGGGDDSSTNTNTNTKPAGTETGVLLDGFVGGVSYTTSSGVTGTTDAQGNFQFNPGDTITFKIGGITLGATVAAQATLTPANLAGTGTNASNVANNLLVFLQSLDADGNHDNGINILPATLSAAASSSLDFSQSTTAFAANSTFANLIATASSTGAKLVTPSAAQANAKKAFFSLIQGTWEMNRTSSSAIVFRFDSNGNYMMGEVGTDDRANGDPGIEVGTLDWNPITNELTSTRSLDTTRQWGLSNPAQGVSLKLKLDGTTLVLEEPGVNGVYTLTKVKNNNSAIFGSWTLDSATNFNTQTFTFFDNGYYMMIDPIGDTEPNPCGGAGVEYGKYQLSNGTLSITKSEVSYDTNNCAGLSDSTDSALAAQFTFSLNADGKSATLGWGTGSGTLYRVAF